MCELFQKVFGSDILLSSTVSIGMALEQLNRDKEVALISIKQQLQHEVNLIKQGKGSGLEP